MLEIVEILESFPKEYYKRNFEKVSDKLPALFAEVFTIKS